jgi:hypothetical protein
VPDRSRENLRHKTVDALANSHKLSIAAVSSVTYTHAHIDQSRAAIARSRALLAQAEERGSIELRLANHR